MLAAMKIATGRIVGGKVVLEGASFEEGTSVTVLARDEEGVTLTPDEEAELLLAIAEADRADIKRNRLPRAALALAVGATVTTLAVFAMAARTGVGIAALLPDLPPDLRVEYQGQLADYDTRILTLSVQKGFFNRLSDVQLSYVNAPGWVK